MAGLKEIARLAEVSIGTASRILNTPDGNKAFSEECVARVRKAAQQLNYVPNHAARTLLSGKTRVIGLALDVKLMENAIVSPYFGPIVGGVELKCRHVEYDLTLIGPSRDMLAITKGVNYLQQHRIDGLIVPGVLSYVKWLHELPRLDLPLVLVECPDQTTFPVVDVDDSAGVRSAVDHLAGLGHRDLLWLGPDETNPRSASLRRRYAMETHAAKLGIRTRSCLFHESFSYGGGEKDYEVCIEKAQNAVAEYLKDNDRSCTGVICYEDAVAFGAWKAITEAGLKIPRDISLVGFDADPVYSMIGLTTVDHMLSEMGQRGMELLLQMIESPSVKDKFVGYREEIKPRFVAGKTVGPANLK